jgi:hypothetical protein
MADDVYLIDRLESVRATIDATHLTIVAVDAHGVFVDDLFYSLERLLDEEREILDAITSSDAGLAKACKPTVVRVPTKIIVPLQAPSPIPARAR